MFESACRIIRILKEYGHEAFIVGGAVRDICLKKEPEYYDIVKPASPVKIRAIAVVNGWKVYDVGKSFQVTMIIIDGNLLKLPRPVQHPASKEHSLGQPPSSCMHKENLSQRDFTINAMAMGLDGEIQIPLVEKGSGIRLIRMVGDVRERIKKMPCVCFV